ncbi:MAG: hypothetical protein LBS94_04270 [Prevotellaceae bacterium]|nr:hypothetical protein [Prevotellaceae bacterium]
MQKISAGFAAKRRCPHCGKGRARLSRWWLVDVEIRLVCSHCKAPLARVSYVCTAVLLALALATLYVALQRLGQSHSIAQAVRITVVLAVPALAVVHVLRLGMLWGLWMLKKIAGSATMDKENLEEASLDKGEVEGKWWRELG